MIIKLFLSILSILFSILMIYITNINYKKKNFKKNRRYNMEYSMVINNFFIGKTKIY